MKLALKKILAVVGVCSLVSTLMACQSEDKTATRNTVTAGGDTPYAVGSSTVFIHDESRPFDGVAGVNSGVRTLITEIWYPVAHTDIGADSVRATYGDYVFGDRDTHRKMLTQTTFFHLTPKSVRDGVSAEDIDLAIVLGAGLRNLKISEHSWQVAPPYLPTPLVSCLMKYQHEARK